MPRLRDPNGLGSHLSPAHVGKLINVAGRRAAALPLPKGDPS